MSHNQIIESDTTLCWSFWILSQIYLKFREDFKTTNQIPRKNTPYNIDSECHNLFNFCKKLSQQVQSSSIQTLANLLSSILM